MKKFICWIVVIAFLFSMIVGCGDSKVIDGKEYETYGLLNEHSVRDPNIHYQTIVGNVVWGIVLCETIIAPVYFFGFSLYEPVEKIK